MSTARAGRGRPVGWASATSTGAIPERPVSAGGEGHRLVANTPPAAGRVRPLSSSPGLRAPAARRAPLEELMPGTWRAWRDPASAIPLG